MDKKEYAKIYYEIHKEEYHDRYIRKRDEIRARNQRNKEIKAMYDKLRYKEKWREKSEYNWEYYRKKKAGNAG